MHRILPFKRDDKPHANGGCGYPQIGAFQQIRAGGGNVNRLRLWVRGRGDVVGVIRRHLANGIGYEIIYDRTETRCYMILYGSPDFIKPVIHILHLDHAR